MSEIRVGGLGDLDALIEDLGVAPRRAHAAAYRVIKRGGLEMKKKMQADFRTSPSFRQIARTVDYDTYNTTAFGRRNVSVEVGPNFNKGGQAALAGIAYFGGARGGGGTVREPDYILEEEVNEASHQLEQALGDLL